MRPFERACRDWSFWGFVREVGAKLVSGRRRPQMKVVVGRCLFRLKGERIVSQLVELSRTKETTTLKTECWEGSKVK